MSWQSKSSRSLRRKRQDFASLTIQSDTFHQESDGELSVDGPNQSDSEDMYGENQEGYSSETVNGPTPAIMTENEKRRSLQQAWKQNNFDLLNPKELAAAVKHLEIVGMTGKNISEMIKGMITSKFGSDYSLKYSTYLKEWNATLSNVHKALVAKGQVRLVNSREKLAMATELMQKKQDRKLKAQNNPSYLYRRRARKRFEKEKVVVDHFKKYLSDKDIQFENLSVTDMEIISRRLSMDGINSIVYTKRLLGYLQRDPVYGQEAVEDFRAARMAYLRSVSSRKQKLKENSDAF